MDASLRVSRLFGYQYSDFWTASVIYISPCTAWNVCAEWSVLCSFFSSDINTSSDGSLLWPYFKRPVCIEMFYVVGFFWCVFVVILFFFFSSFFLVYFSACLIQSSMTIFDAGALFFFFFLSAWNTYIGTHFKENKSFLAVIIIIIFWLALVLFVWLFFCTLCILFAWFELMAVDTIERLTDILLLLLLPPPLFLLLLLLLPKRWIRPD